MSAYVWIDETKKDALALAITIMKGGTVRDISRGKAIAVINDLLDEVERTEDMRMQSLFTIKEV